MKQIGAITLSAILLLSPSFAAAASSSNGKGSDKHQALLEQLAAKLQHVCEKLSEHNKLGHKLNLPAFCRNIAPPLPPPPLPPPPAPTVSLSANPASVAVGATSTLSWQSANASSCVASNGWTGAKNLSGTEIVTLSATTTFSLSCGNGTSTTTAQTTVDMILPSPPPPPPANDHLGPRITNLFISPTSTTPGGLVTFSVTAQDPNGIGNVGYDIRYPDSPAFDAPFYLRTNCNFAGATSSTCTFSQSIDQSVLPTIIGNYVIETVRIVDTFENISTYYPNGTVTGTGVSSHSFIIPVIANTAL